jgi:DEAD/DEAH box helicase domain-containing protein
MNNLHQLDALQLVDALRQRLVDFSLEGSFVRDKQLELICQKIWAGSPEQGGLLSELWVEGAFPAKNSEYSLKDLVSKALFNDELTQQLDKTDAVPSDRKLYQHQYEIIKAVHNYKNKEEKPAMVVTAGTGSGKTESFLLPMLNHLFSQPLQEEQNGVKCLILYPMNALVNDQVGRLYEWLKGQDKVTLFHFTSETPEDKARADRDKVPVFDKCRMRTREQARGNEGKEGRIPDILITNYSMLEYMLCRPQDDVFFGSDLQTVILDEAHLYSGTLAAEMTFLLRRLYQRCKINANHILQIATSATIGDGNTDELKKFIATLFTKESLLVEVIQGQYDRIEFPSATLPSDNTTINNILEKNWLTEPTLSYENDTIQLVKNKSQCESLNEDIKCLTDHPVNLADSEYKTADFLYKTLAHAPLLQQLEQCLWESKTITLTDLAQKLWESTKKEAIQATIILLRLGAVARKHVKDYPLIPHKIHLLTRASDGFMVCLNKNCTGEHKLASLGSVIAGYHEACPYCQSATLSLLSCADCGEWILAGRLDEASTLRPITNTKHRSQKVAFQYFSLQQTTKLYHLNIKTGERTSQKKADLTLYCLQKETELTCPHCQTNQAKFKTFSVATSLILSIISETVLAELPVFPSESRQFLPAEGRRMLTFSDSRQEAARLGPVLTKQHEIQVVRTIIVQALQNTSVADEEVISDLKMEINEQQEKLKKIDLTPGQLQRAEQELLRLEQALNEATAGGSIENWGEILKKVELCKQLISDVNMEQHQPENWLKKGWQENVEAVIKRLSELLMFELARSFVISNSPEYLGLAEITYPNINSLTIPKMFKAKLPTQKLRDKFEKHWSELITAICHSLREDGYMTFEKIEINAAYPLDRPVGFYCTKKSFIGDLKKRKNLNKRRTFIGNILKKQNVPNEQVDELAKEILDVIFSQLIENAQTKLKWLVDPEKTIDAQLEKVLQILVPKLGLRRPQQLYQGEKTSKIYTYSVLGCVLNTNEPLKPITEQQADDNPRFGKQRQEYKNSKFFQMGLWAEEHSAQLAPQENRRLQELFKAGIRNILSSTTTLELGIDIGGLNAVLMSNVPPNKANYLQRAGRAGRRTDGTAIILTFCRPTTYDREVFFHFADYLQKPLRQPNVLLERERLPKRHIHAFLLGYFFQKYVYSSDTHVGAMDAFGNMRLFCGKPLPHRWDKANKAKPELEPTKQGLSELFIEFLENAAKSNEFIKQAISNICGDLKYDFLNDWNCFIDNSTQQFKDTIQSWKVDYDHLLKIWEETNYVKQANAIRYQLLNLGNITVIEALADSQFLPRYGFPIGLKQLKVYEESAELQGRVIDKEDKYRLNRQGLLAMGEYVPGSQLVVGGKIVTSQGLLKHWTGANIDSAPDLRGQYGHCENGHFFYKYDIKDIGTCPVCKAKANASGMEFIIPKHGFSSAAWKPPKRGKDVERVGTTEKGTIAFKKYNSDEKISNSKDNKEIRDPNFSDISNLFAHYQESGELFVYNQGEYEYGFVICLKCGYAESELHQANGSEKLSKQFENHLPLRSPLYQRNGQKSKKCGSDSILRNQTLAAKETTDILLIDFSLLTTVDIFEDIATTIGQALKIAGTKLLQVDSREIGVFSVPRQNGKYGVILYDNVPGGAGHVLELMEQGKTWLQQACDVMYINEQHHQTCKKICLDCLLSFDAQKLVDSFDRKKALSVLAKLCGYQKDDVIPV